LHALEKEVAMTYARKVEKLASNAIIYTKSFLITGTVHILPHERLTELLDSTNKTFIPVTDATIYTVADHRIVGRTKFLSLNKNEIVIVYPKDEDLD
jgi:hypothetical protein